MRVMYARDGRSPRYARERVQGADPQADAWRTVKDLGIRMAREVKKGKVWLLGAGPGDLSLLTRKCLDCIRRADVIVYDNLGTDCALNEAREDAELIYAGKRASHHHLRQEETNRMLVEKALE